MTVAQFTQPNYTTQSAAVYKASIDASIAVLARVGDWFAPHPQDVGSPAPDLSLRLDAGHVLRGVTLTEVAAQTVSGFTTPASGMVRVDRVVLDPKTGVASCVAGTAQSTGSPTAVAPAIPAGKVPICQVSFTASDTAITASMITDERVYLPDPPGLECISVVEASGASSVEFTGIGSQYDAYLLVIDQVVPGTDSTALYLTVSDDSGSSYKNSGYQWVRAGSYAGSTSYTGAASTSDSRIQLVDGTTLDNNSGRPVSGAVSFCAPSSGKLVTFKSSLHFYTTHLSGSDVGQWEVVGGYIAAGIVINAIKLAVSSGTLSGNFRLYGFRK